MATSMVETVVMFLGTGMGSLRLPLRWPTKLGLPYGRRGGLRRASSRLASNCHRPQWRAPPWPASIAVCTATGHASARSENLNPPSSQSHSGCRYRPRGMPRVGSRGWVLRTGEPGLVQGVPHQPHVQRPRAAPLTLSVMQRCALVVPPLP